MDRRLIIGVVAVSLLLAVAGVILAAVYHRREHHPTAVQITGRSHYTRVAPAVGTQTAASPEQAWLAALRSDLCYAAGHGCPLVAMDAEVRELLAQVQVPVPPRPIPRVVETALAQAGPQTWSATSRVQLAGGAYVEFTGRIHATVHGWQVTQLELTG
jgi:hypothetical protein